MIAGFVYLLVGVLVTWGGWRHWRYRKQGTISVLEAATLKATGEEPLPRISLDRFLGYGHAILGFVLGPVFFLLGILVILVELGLL